MLSLSEQVRLTGFEAVVQRAQHLLLVVAGFVGRQQAIDQIAVQLAVEEVGQRDVLGLRRVAHRALGQIAVGDHQIHVVRQAVDGAVGHRDVLQPGVGHFLAQHPGAHGAGTHARIAGDDDFAHGAQIAIDRCRRRCATFGLRFHLLHATGCGFQIVILFHLGGFQQESGHHEGDGKGCAHRRNVGEVGAFRRHRQHRQDRTRRRRRNQAAVQHRQGEDAGHAAQDHRQQQAWVHQHVREVDFVDAAQEVNDCRTAGGLLALPRPKNM